MPVQNEDLVVHWVDDDRLFLLRKDEQDSITQNVKEGHFIYFNENNDECLQFELNAAQLSIAVFPE